MANIQNSANYEKLKNVLKEVFQLDQADLDFGIYRIMNQKRNEINDFLDNRLLPQVKEILLSNGVGGNTKAQQELDKAIEQANALGVDPSTLAKVQELKAKLTSATPVDALEQEVYSHLANFFKRYYKDGDFLSLRRYKKDVYAIPYEGEEVKLHWANRDQYYIKTSEYLKNYGFNLPNGKAVKFELKEASTEQNNNKEQSGKERRFQLYNELPVEVSEDGNKLLINFTYEEYDKKVSQSKLNEDAIDKLVKLIPQEFHTVLEKRPTEKNKNRTLLEKHILDFTARNSFDYFIHKDLGGFLSRELDFYVKNEVLYLDDINTDNELDFTSQLSKVKAIKQVAQKIIIFLAQIENFQKKLWLKKKFVVSTNYCITLDRIPEKYYEEIANNKAQLEEWKKLFKIDKTKSDLLTVEYSEPLNIDFLKSQPYLVLDTIFFSIEFKDKILAEFDDLDEKINGLLVNSENFQALNLLSTKYKENVGLIYTDPPYNAKSSEILYKNTFKHSSWNSFMENRISTSLPFLKNGGLIEVAIDDYELKNLWGILEQLLSVENFVSNVLVIHNPRGRNDDKFFGTSHEYMLVFSNNKQLSEIKNFQITDGDIAQYNKSDEISKYALTGYMRTGNNSNKHERPNLHYSIFVNPNTKELSLDKIDDWIELLPINGAGEEKTWRWGKDTFLDTWKTEILVSNSSGEWKLQKKRRMTGEGKKPKTIWHDARYDASTNGIMLMKAMFGSTDIFSYPKSLYTVEDAISISSNSSDLILDYFGGSATTAHAVIKLNSETGSNRKYIVIEVGTYFNSATKPRVQKSIYSNSWKNGKPISEQGSSHIFKYHDLESYEDVLNNLTLSKNKTQSNLLESNEFKDEYILRYMLDVESKNSLLNIDLFKNPFNYKLNITRNNESQETPVDLVETFNYLIGLHLKTMQTIRGFKVITGVTNERNEETLIIWRNIEEKSNQDLNEFFMKMEFSTRDSEFHRIYVNGDNHLENLKTGDDNWKVVLIEEEFTKRMFDVQDV